MWSFRATTSLFCQTTIILSLHRSRNTSTISPATPIWWQCSARVRVAPVLPGCTSRLSPKVSHKTVLTLPLQAVVCLHCWNLNEQEIQWVRVFQFFLELFSCSHNTISRTSLSFVLWGIKLVHVTDFLSKMPVTSQFRQSETQKKNINRKLHSKLGSSPASSS